MEGRGGDIDIFLIYMNVCIYSKTTATAEKKRKRLVCMMGV
jgi:hypothetical protein